MNIKRELRIQKAKNFAKALHKSHNRLSGESYYVHAQRVYEKLRQARVQDDNILIAALLHQTLTFSKEVETEILKDFGQEVLDLIKNYQRLSNTTVSHEGTKGINEKFIIQTYLNLASDLRVLLIRLADKTDNIETAYALKRDHQIKVANKALYIYAPIARLLGLTTFTSALENEAFKILYPKDYFKVERVRQEREPVVKDFFKKTIPAIRELLKEEGVDAQITYRLKDIYSIHKKALYITHKRNINLKDFDYDDVYDLAAMRVLTKSVENCYKAEALLGSIWDPLKGERDDYITHPKPNGYKSIHNLYEVKDKMIIEAQIRTKEMHEFNEYGPASHLFYKIGESLTKTLSKKDIDLKEFKKWDEESQNSERLSKLQHFKGHVYVFTPLGDIIELPEGATPIDFAYHVHTSVGHSCVGASINGDIQKLDYILQDGDQVSVRTLPSKKKPSRDWLDFVKSSKAKHHIRKALGIQLK